MAWQKALCAEGKETQWAHYLTALPGFQTKKPGGVELIACLENVWAFFRQFFGWPVWNAAQLSQFYGVGWAFAVSAKGEDGHSDDHITMTVGGRPLDVFIRVTQRFELGIRHTGHSEVVSVKKKKLGSIPFPSELFV